MKKLILMISFLTLTAGAVSGCSKNMTNRDVYEESGNTINVNNKSAELYNEGGKPQNTQCKQ